MGLFSFIKNAGLKIFDVAKTTEDDETEVIDDSVKIAHKKALKLIANVKDLGFKVTGLNIEVKDDRATIWGVANSQETREKVVLVVGNTYGIATVEDNMTVAVESPIAQFHTVKKGEYLSEISKKYYDDALKFPIIIEANKPMLEHPNKIYPGQVLRIPPLEIDV